MHLYGADASQSSSRKEHMHFPPESMAVDQERLERFCALRACRPAISRGRGEVRAVRDITHLSTRSTKCVT